MDTQRSRRSSRETPRDAAQVSPAAQRAIDVEDNGELTPSCYHLDQNIVFRRELLSEEAEGRRARRVPRDIAKNLSPYLINRPGEWKLRPGRLHEPARRHDGYELQNGAWILAGTYMKTFTRLTTMESANESARHAVNAVLNATRAPGDRCMIWDPEEWELPDFAALRSIDAKLYKDGYPHMVEILGLDSIPEALLPQELSAREESPR